MHDVQLLGQIRYCKLVTVAILLTALRVSGVGVGGQLRSVQVLPARGEHGDQRLLPGRGVHDAAVPGPLPVDEGSPAVPQPGGVGEAQVSVNYPQCTTAQDRAITRGGLDLQMSAGHF